MRSLLFSIFAFLTATIPPLFANSSPGWEEIHQQQPVGVQLELTLSKQRYAQGERIEATLHYSNSTEIPYTIYTISWTPGATFQAYDITGKSATNPLKWYTDWNPIVVSGPGGIHPIKNYTLQLPINQQLYFDHPGTYTLYAESVIRENEDYYGNSHSTFIVSQKITLVIDPLSKEKEQSIISQARKKISTGDNNAIMDAVDDLSYLQTSDAYAEMLPLLSRTSLSYKLYWSFLTTSNPQELAATILKRVEQGGFILDYIGIDLYSRLKSASLYLGLSPQTLPEIERNKLYQKIITSRSSARDEIIAAQVAASSKGPEQIEALWSAFTDVAINKNPGDKDHDGGVIRSTLAKHQFELPKEHVETLIDNWKYWGSDDFLPLLQQQVAAPFYNPNALSALAEILPDQAIPLISQDIFGEQSKYFIRNGQFHPIELSPELLSRLSPLLQKALRVESKKLPWILNFVEQYGTKDLMPTVREVYRHLDWNSDQNYGLKNRMLRFWIQHEPQTGIQALSEALPKHEYIEHWQPLIGVLYNNWTPLALPLVLQELNSSKVEVVHSAALLLVENADVKYAEQVVSALERTSKGPENEDPGYATWRRDEVAYRAKQIAGTSRWHFTADQYKRLQALVNAAPPPKNVWIQKPLIPSTGQ